MPLASIQPLQRLSLLEALAAQIEEWILSGALEAGAKLPSEGSLSGQFGVGVLLGAVWSPCVGPTLGAASLLAAQGENLSYVAITMLMFGLGAALPLLLLGLLSRETLLRWRERLYTAGRTGKIAMGVILVAVGILAISGLDKRLETVLVDLSPAWLTEITTRY